MPSASSCFLLAFGFAGNQYLRRSKYVADLTRFFLGNKKHWKLREASRGATCQPHGHVARPGGWPRHLSMWGPRLPPWPDSTAINPYKYRNYPSFLQNNFIAAASLCFEETHLEPCSGVLPEGEAIGGGLFINLAASMTMCELFLQDLWVHSSS